MQWGDQRLPERFWEHAIPEPNSGCWLWNGYTDPHDYGRIKNVIPGQVLAHKIAFHALNYDVPEGLELDHRCRVTSCVNPEHLECVTHEVNIFRGESPAAKNARKTHCFRGHEFTPENTFIREDNNGRCCIACAEINQELKKTGNPVGHPRLELTFAEVYNLRDARWPWKKIAEKFGCSIRTCRRRLEGK